MPLDIEEILRKKKEEHEAASKIKFKSKRQRDAEAAEKAALEAQEKQRQRDLDAQRRDEEERAWLSRANGRTASSLAAAGGNRQARIPTGPQAMNGNGGGGGGYGGGRAFAGEKRPRERQQSSSMPDGGDRVAVAPAAAAAPEDVEARLLRERYLGPEVNQSSKFSAQRKRQRTTERKFKFSWDNDEDTSRQNDPIYDRPVLTGGGGGGGGGSAPAGATSGAGGEFDDVAEARARDQARMIEKLDREDGRRRAGQLMDDFYAARERYRFRTERMGLGKHWSEKPLDDMRERDWRIFKEDFGIATKGGSIPNPMRSWPESGLPRRLLDIVASVGYDEPTPIQRAAIPIALQARDLIGVAVTGSGKTAAFLLPLLVYISDLPPLDELTRNDGPYALILAPTRELVQQIQTEARRFAGPLGFRCVSLVGGHDIQEQSLALQDGAEIVVATPGRLVDCIERRLLVLQQCCYLIMDEADRMIDLGFEDSVNKILAALPASNEKPDTDDAEDGALMRRGRYRQTMMYTATMPPLVERIAKNYLRRPAIVTIGNIGQAVETVEQRVEFISGEDRRKRRLGEILSSGEFAPPIIVFVNIKRNCDAVARDIRTMGFSVATMHGSKTQDQREASLLSVRGGQADVLVATDLAGRGIDVPDVSLVINFNMATNIESYTHRIGRTGRAGKSGISITFLGPEDTDVLYDLRQMLSKSTLSRVPEELRRHEAAQQKPSRGGGKKVVD